MSEEEKAAFCLLDIDPSTITWKRVTDTNDRFLRTVDVGMGPAERTKAGEQLSRTSGFAITVASEIMAVQAPPTPQDYFHLHRPPAARRLPPFTSQ